MSLNSLLRGFKPFTFELHVTVSGTGTVTISPPDLVCTDECRPIYSKGSVVSLIATPSENSVFEGWSGDVQCSEIACAVTMDATKKVVANFSLITKQDEKEVLSPLESFSDRFVDNGDSTVTDNETKLMWDRYCYGQSGISSEKYLPPPLLSWAGASSISRTYAGYDDWRLPTIAELQSIASEVSSNRFGTFPLTPSAPFWSSSDDEGKWKRTLSFFDQSIRSFAVNACHHVRLVRDNLSGLESDEQKDSEFSELDQRGSKEECHLLSIQCVGTGTGTVTRTPPDLVCSGECRATYNKGSMVGLIAAPSEDSVFAGWSGDVQGGDLACTVNMDAAKKVVANFSRLAQEERIGNFLDHGDGTVSDTRTGLMWKRFAEGQDWLDGHCVGLAGRFSLAEAKALKGEFSDYNDWRLPTIDELQSLIEESRKNPAFDPVVFPGYEKISPIFWTSSASRDFRTGLDEPWAVSFYSGSSSKGHPNSGNSVRLVRNSNPSSEDIFGADSKLAEIASQRIAPENVAEWSGTGFEYLLREVERADEPSANLIKALTKQPEIVSRSIGRLNRTLLHHAAAHHKLETVKYLCQECHADINSVDKDGETPLDYALATKATSVVDYLRALGAKTHKETIEAKPNADQSRAIIKQPEIVSRSFGRFNRTLLHHAVANHKLERVKYLCDVCNADINAVDSEGETPLDYALAVKAIPIVDYLSALGAKSHKEAIEAKPNVDRSFDKGLRLKIETVGAGEVVVSPQRDSYELGTRVKISVTPSTGWRFKGWTGYLNSNTEKCSMVMDADRHITAHFELLSKPILLDQQLGNIAGTEKNLSFTAENVASVSPEIDTNTFDLLEILQRLGALEAGLSDVLLRLAKLEAAPPELIKNTENIALTVTSLSQVLAWLVTQERVPLAGLRERLLPLDQFPGAFIDEINEKALDLVGDLALEEVGDEIIVTKEVCVKVIETLE